jgi:acetyl-CoA C-acetyltransferase
MDVPAVTLNKLCLSGLSAIAYADQLIRSGQHDVVVAGGLESMTNAPHLLMDSRRGTKYGATRLVDALDRDALVCAFDDISMGAVTERYQGSFGITRAAQDEFAARSHQLAGAAVSSGRFAEEIVDVADATGAVLLANDEGVRPGTVQDRLAELRPAFASDGTITAGNASQLSDGAAAAVMTSRSTAERLGLTWLAEIGAHGTVAGPDPSLLVQPANAIRDALRRDGSARMADLAILEINEAFASVALASIADLGADPSRVKDTLDRAHGLEDGPQMGRVGHLEGEAREGDPVPGGAHRCREDVDVLVRTGPA